MNPAISCSDGCGQNRYLNYSACSIKLISSTTDQEQQDFRSYLSSCATCNYTFFAMPFVLYCAQEGEGLCQLEVWAYPNFGWALQWLSRDHSLLIVSTGTQLWSLPSPSSAGMHSLTGVDMMENVKHKKNRNQKGLCACSDEFLKSQHLILFCPFQNETTGKSLKNCG